MGLGLGHEVYPSAFTADVDKLQLTQLLRCSWRASSVPGAWATAGNMAEDLARMELAPLQRR